MSGPHLFWMRVHYLLADGVQLRGVANEAQIFLLDNVPDCLPCRFPHLMENLRDTKGTDIYVGGTGLLGCLVELLAASSEERREVVDVLLG